MKILFLDDMASRRRVAQQWFPGDHEIVFAKTAAEAIGLYFLHQSRPTEGFDLVSLDHDLGEQFTGLDVVDFIIDFHKSFGFQPAKFAVHCWNPVGARRMANALALNGYTADVRPFSPPALLDGGAR
jgi:CheY-like chemotaxis protein